MFTAPNEHAWDTCEQIRVKIRLLAICFSLEIQQGYEERCFSLKGRGTRHGHGLLPFLAILPLSLLLP